MNDLGLRLILGAFLLLCLACFAAGATMVVRTVAFARRAQRATAEITERVSESAGVHGGVRTRARARFLAARGEPVEVSFSASELPDPGAAVGGSPRRAKSARAWSNRLTAASADLS